MKTALVTSLGSVSGDIVIKSLKKIGMRVIGCDIYPKEWVADAYNVDSFYRAPYVSDWQNYISFIHDVCIKEKVDFLLPLIDIEIDLLSKNRRWFEEHNVCLCMSPEETLDICRNKKAFTDYIEQNCPMIRVIPTKYVDEVDTGYLVFPLVCKPVSGRSSQGLRYIHSEQEWDVFTQIDDKSNYIVQPYVEGSLFVVDVVRNPVTNQTIAIPREELIRTPHGCGTTVVVFQDEELEKSCIELSKMLGIYGCVNYEFIRDAEGNYWIVECNPRFSAGIEFSCLAGYEMIINHMNCFMNNSLDDYKFKHKYYIARKYEEYVTKIDVDNY